MPILKFFDVKTKRFFKTDKYRLETIKGRKHAIAKRDGYELHRIVPHNFKGY